MAVEFQGYWSWPGTFEDFRAGRVPLQKEMPDEAIRKWQRTLAEVSGCVVVEESEPEDPPAA